MVGARTLGELSIVFFLWESKRGLSNATLSRNKGLLKYDGGHKALFRSWVGGIVGVPLGFWYARHR